MSNLVFTFHGRHLCTDVVITIEGFPALKSTSKRSETKRMYTIHAKLMLHILLVALLGPRLNSNHHKTQQRHAQ